LADRCPSELGEGEIFPGGENQNAIGSVIYGSV
jgi:hypothetical protein